MPIESLNVPVLLTVPAIISNDFSSDEVIHVPLKRQLICYCDGSYSPQTQIGCSGFLASDGFSQYRSCPLRRPRSGSTESEVYAACLALQYTAEYYYDTVTLCTDNSKVEQLLTRPKSKDYSDYPELFNAVNHCGQIQIKRVRGHTTRLEQEQCPIKREFAKVDRCVRRKRRRHEQRIRRVNNIINSRPISYSFQYGSRYIQVMYPEKFGHTLVITSSRPILSYY